MGLPAGIQNHFCAVRDLLNWLQVNILCPFRSFNLGFPASFIYRRIFGLGRNNPNNEEHESASSSFVLDLLQ